jgi:Holliday junction resolvase-like predicted endonuclease
VRHTPILSLGIRSSATYSIRSPEFFEKLQELTDLFGARFLEISTLSEEAMQAAAGVSAAAFKNFRAACLALAEFHTLLLEAMWTCCSNNDQLAQDAEFHSEFLDQLTPCWRISVVHALLAQLAKISLVEVESLMDIYAFVAGTDTGRAEGFCPPFIASDDIYIFLPLSAQYAMSSRNISYSCLQKHPKRFDDEVSSFLEPRLIDVADRIFSCLNGVRVERNVRWSDGEIDLVVYSESEKTILLVEAKAAVAPEGGRMIRNTESRVHYGLTQLAKFKALSSEEKERILSNVFGQGLEDVKYVDVVLTWAGFGTEAVWSKFEDATPVNIALLANLIYSSPGLKLAEFESLCSQLINEVVAAANPIWETVEGRIGDLSFSYPLLSFDSDALVKYQVAPHKFLRKNKIVV